MFNKNFLFYRLPPSSSISPPSTAKGASSSRLSRTCARPRHDKRLLHPASCNPSPSCLAPCKFSNPVVDSPIITPPSPLSIRQCHPAITPPPPTTQRPQFAHPDCCRRGFPPWSVRGVGVRSLPSRRGPGTLARESCSWSRGSARLANISLGGARQDRSLPTAAPGSSSVQDSSNADNAASADLGLIGLAVM